ncbi:PREDICTED: transcription factor PRE6-like [Nelumbo nucifera]|uniref:Transcription factor PRE6-like n=1 Tax=Nelumbo nucifera TaxID=4432 RepID=A0A1U7YTH3_NELNU|nr:PREDICTED: transcription factor PRE6-like [Nelumbo nucifera]
MSGSRRSEASPLTQDEINDLVLKSQELLPEIRRRAATGVTASEILKEICNYIKRLKREVDGLSQRLSELMASIGTNSREEEILRSLLMQE